MKIRLCACLFAATAVAALAQKKDAVDPQAEGLRVRGDMAAAVGRGLEKPEAALARLKKHDSPSGLKTDRDADFAFAAIDVGRRLIAAGKPEDAEKFFREAEKSLESVLKKTPDTAARDRAQYLRKLALIRSQYLNKVPQAKADLDEAIRLQPEDKHLRSTRDSVAAENAEHFREKPPAEGRK